MAKGQPTLRYPSQGGWRRIEWWCRTTQHCLHKDRAWVSIEKDSCLGRKAFKVARGYGTICGSFGYIYFGMPKLLELFWYQSHYPHMLRDSVSPVCGIFHLLLDLNKSLMRLFQAVVANFLKESSVQKYIATVSVTYLATLLSIPHIFRRDKLRSPRLQGFRCQLHRFHQLQGELN